MADIQYSGDDLLKVLDSVNVNTGSVHPNVIRAWFDSDCPKTSDLLNWICSAINQDNHLSALDKIEFEEIKQPLRGEELDKECRKLEAEYPGIFQFDSELSETELELLESELRFLEERDAQLDREISMHNRLSDNLDKEITLLQSKEIPLCRFENREEQELCLKLSRDLDEANVKLHERICNYRQYLNDYFMYDETEFINCINVHELEKQFESITNHVISLVKVKNDSNNSSSSMRVSVNGLNEIRESLLHSYLSCSHYQLKAEVLRKTEECLKTANSSISYDILQVGENLDLHGMKERNSLLLEMVQKTVEKFVDSHVNRSKLKSIKDEVIYQEFILSRNTKIEQTLTKLFAIYAVLRILLDQEKSDIDSSFSFFQDVFKYIQYDIHASLKRQRAMFEITENYEDFKLKRIEEQLPFINELGKLLDVDISKGLPSVSTKYQCLEYEVVELEKKVYATDIQNHLKSAKLSSFNLGILKKFIFGGPTNQIVSIPPPLYLKFKEVDGLSKKQQIAVKTAVQIWKDFSKRMKTGKWATHKRQLWMVFLENPDKVQSIIDDLEREVRSKENI